MAQFLAVAFTASIVGGLYIKLRKYKYWSRAGLPSLTGSLPFGFANRFVFKSSNVSGEFQNVYNEFKSKRHVGIYMFFSPVYVPVDPKIVKAILEGDNFSQRNIYHSSKRDALFNKLFYSNQEDAVICRQKVSKLFETSNKDVFVKTIANALSTVPDTTNGDLEVTEYLNLINATIIKQLFINECVNTTNEAQLQKNLSKLSSPQEYFATKSVLSLLSSNILKLLFARISNKRATNFFAIEIEKAITYRQENEAKGDFLDVLLTLEDTSSIISDIIMLILGNCKFVSSTVSCCLFELAKNGDIQDKLRQEILQTIDSPDKITLENVEGLPYLNQVVSETLRKYPTVSIIKRSNTNSFVPAQSSVNLDAELDIIIPIAGLHHDPDYFQDPDVFNPDRFNDENIGNIQEYTYIPYGSGNRNCIGKDLADLQLKIILITLLKKYKINLVSNDQVIELQPNSLITRPKEVNLIFEKI